jgi:hypothetical protein
MGETRCFTGGTLVVQVTLIDLIDAGSTEAARGPLDHHLAFDEFRGRAMDGRQRCPDQFSELALSDADLAGEVSVAP